MSSGASPSSQPQPRKRAAERPRIDIVVLTKGRDLLQNVLSTARFGYRIHHAASVKRAEQLVQSEPVGVLITNALPDSLPRILPQLRTWNPNLVTVAIGRRSDADALMRLAEQGDILRFLLAPVPNGQLNLYIDAAMRAYLERLQTTIAQARGLRVDARESRQSRPALPFSLAAMIFLSSASGLFLLGQGGGDGNGGGADAVAKTLELDDDGRALARALVAAERAREERRFVEPEGDNAYYYYRQILALEPNHREAARGINDLVNLMFTQAEAALKDARFAESRAALDRARRIAPSHPRLGVIGSQVDAAEQQSLLDAALAAARRGEFAQGERLIGEAASSRLGESSALRQTRVAFTRIREDVSARREALVTGFEASLAEGRLLPPWEDNAQAMLEELERLNAPGEIVTSLHDRLGEALEDAVEEAIASGAVEKARLTLEALTAHARTTLAVVRAEELAAELAAARTDALEAQRLLDLARARLAEDRLLRPVGDNAIGYVEALLTLPEPPTGSRELGVQLGEQLVARAVRAMHEGDMPLARTYLDEAARLDIDGIGLEEAEFAWRRAASEAGPRLSTGGAVSRQME